MLEGKPCHAIHYDFIHNDYNNCIAVIKDNIIIVVEVIVNKSYQMGFSSNTHGKLVIAIL